MNEQFKNDVAEGLGGKPKFLSSKYFYDEIGDDLFVQIMRMPEYYLTDAEFEIFAEKNNQITEKLGLQADIYFELIELGAGDGTKTKELLKPLVNKGYKFSYSPVDISEHALVGLRNSLAEEIPALEVTTKQGDYFDVLNHLKKEKHPKIVLFLGSNLGNLKDDQAQLFLKKIGETLNEGDKLLLGVDMIKDARIVLPAYKDEAGITSKFNMNLLTRINRELGGNFDTSQFYHHAYYTEEEGIAKSYIVSKQRQEVYIQKLEMTYTFDEEEKIHVEISRKYNDQILKSILTGTNLTVQDKLMDTKSYFADYILAVTK